MTDNEIIKALECCLLSNEQQVEQCQECPMCETPTTICQNLLSYYALTLINRQKAEINELKSEQEILQKLYRAEKDTVKMLQQKCEDCAVRTLRVRIE